MVSKKLGHSGYNGVHATKDGGAIFISSPIPQNSEPAWQAFCEFGGDPELGTDPRFNTTALRAGSGRDPAAQMKLANEVLRPRTSAMFASKTTAEWQEYLGAQNDIIWEKVHTCESAVRSCDCAADCADCACPQTTKC